MKNKVIFVLLGIAISLLLIIDSTSALGVSPARIDINFEPNAVRTLDFNIFHGIEGRKIAFSVEGDLARYVTLDNTEFYNEGRVKATIKFPQTIETPGENRIYLVASEEPPQNQFIGTAVKLKASIVVH